MAEIDSEIVKSYELIRECVVHEDNLVHQRITWLITLNGLLFTALGLTISAGFKYPDAINIEPLINRLRLGLFFAGFSSSVVAYVGIAAAYTSMRHDRMEYYKYFCKVEASIGFYTCDSCTKGAS